MLKGTITKLTTFLCSIFLVLSVVVPFKVSAITGYSYDIEANVCIEPIYKTNNNFQWYFIANKDYNLVIMKYSPNSQGQYEYVTYLFSNESFSRISNNYNINNGFSCPVNPTYNTSATHYTNNGLDFYYYAGTWGYSPYSGNEVVSPYNYNQSTFTTVSSVSNAMIEEAFQYYNSTSSSISYGDLITGYSTKFVTTNFEGLNDRNIDTITWSDNDTNGNFIGGLDYQVEIRALPAYYTANSASTLVQQTVVNLIKGLATWYSNGVIQAEPEQYYTLVKTSASRKEFSIMWSDVINHFPQNWARLFNEGSLVRNMSNEEVWYKTGWLYEIRFLYNEGEEDEYISDWKTIYQVTSVDPGTSTQIIQTAPQGLSPELYNLLQTVNTLNNTVQNWNINGVPVNMEPQTTPTQDGSWLEYIVDAISKIVGQIVETLGNIVEALLGFGSDIIEGLFNLITSVGVNIIDTFTDLWNRLIELIGNINFTDENPEYDLNPETGESVLDIIPAFIRMINTSGLGYMIWIPFVVGIVFMIL